VVAVENFRGGLLLFKARQTRAEEVVVELAQSGQAAGLALWLSLTPTRLLLPHLPLALQPSLMLVAIASTPLPALAQ
jgi:hypothetical protein